uniref:FAST kinase domain-containing protein 2 n=1 Tax=Lygus hesperus TaxID=30085 RepID=A0A0A9VVG1_LYGHE
MNHMYRALRSSQQWDVSTASLLRMSLLCIQRNYCFSKEIIDPPLSQGQDILLQNMRSATDVSDVLYAIKLHHAIMNNKHLMQAFRSIFSLQKSYSSNMSNGEVISSTGFRVLCETLKSNVRSLDTGEVLDALKTLSYLGVSSNSKLIQILLHALTKEINSLSLQQLLFFDFLLKDFSSSPIVEALRIALPVVVESNVKMKANKDNLSHLCDLLHYASKKDLSDTTVNFLVDSIMKKRRSFDFKTSKSIIRSLCDVKNPDGSHSPLLHCAIQVLIDNIHLCSYFDFDSLISKLASKYSAKNSYFYHEVLLDTASRYIISAGCKFEEAIWHLRKLQKFGHVSLEFLDFVSQTIERQPALLNDCDPLMLFTLVGGLAQADYHPAAWTMMEPLILRRALAHLDDIELPWVRFTRDLCTLHSWPMDLFCRLFSDDSLRMLHAKENITLSHLQLLSLYSSVVSLCDWYNGPHLPSEFIEKVAVLNYKPTRDFSLKGYISNVLKNKDGVVTGVMTRLGHFIDYLVIWRKEGYAESISHLQSSSQRIFVEDIAPPGGSLKLAFIHLPANSYTSNTAQFRGPTRMMIDSLECVGITVIPLSSIVWEELQENEKSPYILQQIKGRLSNWDSMTNSCSRVN